jgi:hypothetical protein
MSKMTHEQFFGVHGDDYVRLFSFGDDRDMRVEDLYQHFKNRIMAELAVQAPDLRTLGVLVERPEK